MGLTRIRAEQISDIDYKQAVRVIELNNVTLSGGAPLIVDGVTVAYGDRILVSGQNTASQNGIYDVTVAGSGSNGTWIRTSDANATGEINAGMIVMVTEGTTYADTSWKLITNDPIVIGTTGLVFAQNTGNSFGVINANGTPVVANGVTGTAVFSSGNNLVLTGNATSDTITFAVNDTPIFTTVSATGNISGNYILGNGALLTGVITSVANINSGNSNVTVVSSGGNVTVGVGGTNNVAVFSTTGEYVTGIISASGNIFGGGIRSTSSGTAPSDPSVGDFWYNTSTNVQYRFTFDGTSYYWIDDFGSTTGVNGTFNAITNGTSNVTAGTLNGDITVGVGGTPNVIVVNSSGATINGNLTVTGNATLSGNILGDRIQNGTTLIDIQTQNGNANITIGGVSNIAVFATTGAYVAGVISATGNISGNLFIGNGAGLTNINAANITGAYNNTNVSSFLAAFGSNTISTSGTINSGNITGNYIIGNGSALTLLTGANVSGNVANANSAGIAYTAYAVSGANVSGQVANALIAGTVTTNAQPNITSVGTLTSLNSGTISSSGNVTATNILTAGLISATGNITGGSLSVGTGTITVGNIVNANGNAVGNIGSSSNYFNTVFANANSALYADLAEIYIADDDYEPGTLVIFGGEKEITVSDKHQDTRVAGVISTDPAYLMNSGSAGLPVALTGRIPCKIVGSIQKGDRLVTSGIKGVATVLDPNKYQAGCIIGKALQEYNSNEIGVIEIAVGRY